jgi:hypothetical protein
MRRHAQQLLMAACAFTLTMSACTTGHHAVPSRSVRTLPATDSALPSVQYRPPEGPALGVPFAVDGVMSTFFLDRGALHVNQPPESLHPAESMARALTAAKEADTGAFSFPGGPQPVVVGYGLVTIDRRYWRKPVYQNTPAWVVAYQDNRPSSCPASRADASPAPKPTPPLPKHHYTVFVLPDAETWAVTFVERGFSLCGGKVFPSQATLAESSTFIHWHVVSRDGTSVTVGYTLPSCADDGGYSSSGGPSTDTLSLDIAETVPFGHPPNCRAVQQRTKTIRVSSATAKLEPPRSGPAIF